MDILSEFFERTHLQGRLFFAGRVDGTLVLDKPPGMAFVHVIENGGIDLVRPGVPKIAIDEPSVLFCPSSCQYQLRSTASPGADIICASFQFGQQARYVLPLGLTETLVFPLEAFEHIVPAISSLTREFRDDAPGRGKALNLLFEYVFILLVRQAVQQKKITSGLLFALQDGRLGEVLRTIHREPEADWSVEQLAALANMSRSKFSAYFSRIMNVSPIVYLTHWRMRVAQDMLRDGVQIKIIAASVGYSSQASFSRTFMSIIGVPPAEWIKRVNQQTHDDDRAASHRMDGATLEPTCR
ncbi:AraC family transcriptional regulator [Pseudomonas sp. CCI3.2]|uniref:helix-turn-helix transcriptional regulator n=1 Tax=unclassified Pseudomonas TaxID=196821 RepID=UPI002AC99F9A|nr:MULTISPECIES: AraC family transcriptional regulator [unclassified Pseudomonas]MEB0077151.1 AraC family transcriptional regulator [Pseudomonas sp. MH10out]MEB0093050.1 AraC family transcriptional regulator [Pseudomonas sp. CCI4.2]MEB0102254.1 AraC family transcriptional regulator [Pseudomonas sp. CCI3.2]MEB0129386.1 AraC family transcriptional regulator [Pseudomonas sp. CCI2.4]MEB0158760.1 AraC family transcriptional regulator [Pseudomonas sp. AH2 (2023)]